MNSVKKGIIFVVMCAMAGINSHIFSVNSDKQQVAPSAELIEIISRGAYETDAEYVDVVKRIKAEGHSVESCFTYMCAEKRKKALDELLENFGLPKDRFYKDLDECHANAQTLFKKPYFFQKRGTIFICKELKEEYPDTLKEIERLHKMLCPKLDLDISIGDNNKTFAYTNIFWEPSTKKINCGKIVLMRPILSEWSQEIINAVLVHEFIHIIRHHCIEEYYLGYYARQNNVEVKYDGRNKNNLYLRYSRAHEVEADIMSHLLTRGIGQCCQAQINQNWYVKNNGRDPKTRAILKWTKIIDKLLQAEEKLKKQE